MQHQVTISDEEVDRLLVAELQQAYIMQHEFELDHELINAMDTVLKYYMSEAEYTAWANNKSQLVQVCCESHGGPVGMHCNHDHCTGPRWVEKKCL